MSPLINPAVHGGVREGEQRSLLGRPFVWAIRGYQIAISPALGQVCRFYPSCSAYTVTAIERYGPLRGIWLGGRRLLRCHPWSSGGVDHVPPRPGQAPRTPDPTPATPAPSGTTVVDAPGAPHRH